MHTKEELQKGSRLLAPKPTQRPLFLFFFYLHPTMQPDKKVPPWYRLSKGRGNRRREEKHKESSTRQIYENLLAFLSIYRRRRQNSLIH